MKRSRTSVVLLAASMLAISAGACMAGEIVWWTPNWGEARARVLADKFMKANPNTSVKLEVTTADGLPQRVLTALQSGAPPDLIEVQHGWVPGYAQNDLIIPLDDTIQDRKDYLPAALNYVSWDNKLWAVPYRIDTLAVIYNKGHFRDAGLDPDKPPQTWDELVKTATALTRDGRFGFAVTGGGEVGNTIFRSLPFIWMNGGSIISGDAQKATVNKPEAVAAVKFYTDFYKKKLSPASTLENDGIANRQLFIAEKVSMYQAGQFDIDSIRKGNPKIDIGVMAIPHPAGKETAAVLGGWSYIIPKGAKNPDETKKFVQFLNTSENQGYFTDTFPARVSAMGLPRFDDPILAGFKAMLPYGRPVPINKNWVQITQAYFNGVQSIMLGNEDPQAAMDSAADEIQSLLDQ